MSAGSKLKTASVTVALIGAVAAGGYFAKPYLVGSMGAGPAVAQTAPQAMPVKVAPVETQQIRLWSEFSGRLSAIDQVELRPQVSGTIQEVRFEDGQMVQKGDVLMVIDPRPYEAAVAEAKAELNAAGHTLRLAKKQRVRAEQLVKKGHVSKAVRDQRVSDHTVAVSRVNSAKAQLIQAEINLNYAYVKAPISGRLSRAEITVGNLVEAGPNAPVLTSIVSTDEIYADFDVDERNYLRYVHELTKVGGAVSELPVELTIDVGELRVYKGHIHSFDNQIDPATGTIRARAIFSNESGSLLPGMFAELRLGGSDVEDLVLLNPGDIGTDQDRKFVYVVGEGSTVEYREVALGASVEGKRVITRGLAQGDQVILGGLMKVRPGVPVTPILPETAQTAETTQLSATADTAKAEPSN
ncbi:efflux RND transporter periplasmic adaptor subunit [Denitrobaculum tricleocarpae]|uniref:Efflux RND transporter periplasmic adaptor subunit n=1 Tax=Denitrobaculum tricleocarpae TaxID=2591009 RepID=A0A545TF08_9PROT|nr:efflux RND transporter periplasmic adaptor subunit [Denitrobaculum tricleocarpae]TQV75813.1 efflux RND transporter periplasmic adaptor subunit [Denitrobaculum tricleocarpae]